MGKTEFWRLPPDKTRRKKKEGGKEKGGYGGLIGQAKIFSQK
jgi:hypothetical protein